MTATARFHSIKLLRFPKESRAADFVSLPVALTMSIWSFPIFLLRAFASSSMNDSFALQALEEHLTHPSVGGSNLQHQALSGPEYESLK